MTDLTESRPRRARLLLWLLPVAAVLAVGAVAWGEVWGGPASDAAEPPATSSSAPATSTSASAAPVVAEQPDPVTPARLVDACKAHGQYYAVPAALFGVAVSDPSNAVEVVWESADLAPGEFSTQSVVTGTGTAEQHGAVKAFTYRCVVAAGADAEVATFDVTPR